MVAWFKEQKGIRHAYCKRRAIKIASRKVVRTKVIQFRRCIQTTFIKLDLSISTKAGVAKLYEPRTEFATAWPQEGQIQCDLRDRQQPMLLHCCPQSETGVWKSAQGTWRAGSNWSAGRMRPAGRSLATPALEQAIKTSQTAATWPQWCLSTHTCSSGRHAWEGEEKIKM